MIYIWEIPEDFKTWWFFVLLKFCLFTVLLNMTVGFSGNQIKYSRVLKEICWWYWKCKVSLKELLARAGVLDFPFDRIVYKLLDDGQSSVHHRTSTSTWKSIKFKMDLRYSYLNWGLRQRLNWKWKQTNTTFPLRSNQTIERKKAEARAERELAARKREDAKRAKDEVNFFNFDEGISMN